MDYEGLTSKLLSSNGKNENSDPLMNRREDKYLVSRSYLEKLTSTLRDHLKEGETDTQARFNTTTTVYLDTKDLDCFRDAVSNVKPRFKVRIRHYAPNGKPEEVAYLELKIKTLEGLTKKTRIRIPQQAIEDLAEGRAIVSLSEQLTNLNRDVSPQVLMDRIQTINETLKKYGFRKQVCVSYERRAYADASIRVTVDDHLRYFMATDLGDAKALIEDTPGFGGREKLADKIRTAPYVILEVKHRGTVPPWLESLMKEVKAESVRFSKYCTAIIDFSKDGGFGSGKMMKDGIDIQPLMALFHDSEMTKSKKDKEHVNIAAVILRDKNFILVGKRRKNDKWGLPGGRFEEGESKEEVALRELKEETGIKLKASDLTYEGKKTVEGSDEIKSIYVFSAKHPGGEPTGKNDPDREFTDWEWARCENGMLPAKILDDKMNKPASAAFEKMGLTKSDDQIQNLIDKLEKGKKDKYFVSIVPVTEFGEVLLGKRTEDGIWTTPGGGADPGEEPHEAARRELFEEAGLAAPPNSLELVGIGETPRGFKIYSFLWRMPKVLGEAATSKLDPDREVKNWKLLRPENFPAAMSEEKNASRLKTIREALMRLYAVKSEEDSKVISLVEKLSKGGPGSGIQGHVTARKPSPLHPSVKAPVADPQTKLQTHLTALQHGKVMPGMNTQSGKPIVNDMDTARAHSYDVQDHVDAMNAHYELAQRTQAILEKLKTAGHKVPEEGKKIANFHEKKMKEHMRARQHLEERKTHTAAAIKEKKDEAIASVKKSVTQMGGGLGDRDLDVGAFAQANGHGSAEWMEKLYSGMQGFEYGADPREFRTNKGVLHLAKVDDGLYSGYLVRDDEPGLLDSVRMRIERITIPELVQLLIAKEWINNHIVEAKSEDQVPAPAPIEPVVEPMPLQAQEAELVALNEKLEAPAPISDKIRLLELIAKLLG